LKKLSDNFNRIITGLSLDAAFTLKKQANQRQMVYAQFQQGEQK